MAADPLFEGLPETLQVQSSHRDALVELPIDAQCLASNSNSDFQAFAWGSNLRAVQFHPELRAEVLADLLEARGLEGACRPSEHGRKILKNWVRHWLK
jgi:GMP synthase (glutamine-hydrolysing)